MNFRMELGSIDENAFAISPTAKVAGAKTSATSGKNGKEDEKESEAEWIVVDDKMN